MGRDEGTLLDIAKAARAVLTFTQDLQKEQFLEDAVGRALSVDCD